MALMIGINTAISIDLPLFPVMEVASLSTKEVAVLTASGAIQSLQEI